MALVESIVSIQRSVPIYLNAEVTDEQSCGWLVCHGYGQRADHIIRKWDGFDTATHRVVSAEAPHRFYWAGVTGRPVATWMTSRLRLADIEDNNSYLDTLYGKYLRGMAKRVVFGFSQGGTTLWRWVHARRPAIDLFIDYAGSIPEDIDLSVLQEYAKDKTIIFCYGDRDEYMTDEKLASLRSIVAKSGLDVYWHNFEGTHSVDRAVLQELYHTYMAVH